MHTSRNVDVWILCWACRKAWGSCCRKIFRPRNTQWHKKVHTPDQSLRAAKHSCDTIDRVPQKLQWGLLLLCSVAYYLLSGSGMLILYPFVSVTACYAGIRMLGKGIERNTQWHKKVHTPDQSLRAAKHSCDTIDRVDTEIHIFEHDQYADIGQDRCCQDDHCVDTGNKPQYKIVPSFFKIVHRIYII